MIRRKEVQHLILIEGIFVFLLGLLLFLEKIESPTFLIVIFTMLGCNISFFWILYKESRQIEKLSHDMNRILNGDYSIGILDYEEGDISNLKSDIDQMTIKLKEQTEQSQKDKKYLEEILSDISHQMKTPLTSMYVMNDLFLEDNTMSEEVRREFLLKNKEQLERIEWLVTSLLKMSRLDSGTETLKRKTIHSSDLILSAVEPLKIPIELKRQTLEINYHKDPVLFVDPNWTREALLNILKNAHEHTEEKGIIKIEVTETPIYYEITVTDTGSGISKEDLPHIFERFYKGSGNKESIGIGLHMAKKIITMQEGEIRAISLRQGTKFEIRFYKRNF